VHPLISAEAARLRGEDLRIEAEHLRRNGRRAPRRALRSALGRGLIAAGSRLADQPPDPLAWGP